MRCTAIGPIDGVVMCETCGVSLKNGEVGLSVTNGVTTMYMCKNCARFPTGASNTQELIDTAVSDRIVFEDYTETHDDGGIIK